MGTAALTLPWSQFGRLRYATGPSQDLFSLLEQYVVAEHDAAVARTPLPYVLDRNGWRIIFTGLWSSFDDGETEPPFAARAAAVQPSGETA